MPVYNGEKFIRDSISSVLEDELNSLIVINDGSTDSTKKILDEFSFVYSERLTVYNIKNCGVSKSLNFALSKITRPSWIFRIDADDINYYGRTKEMIDYMHNNNLDVCGSFSTTIDEFGRIGHVNTYPTNDLAIKISLEFDVSPFCHPSIVFSPRITNLLKYPDHKFEDLYLFKFLKDLNVVFGNYSDPLVFYRHHNDQITKSTGFYDYVGFGSFVFSFLKSFFLFFKGMSLKDSIWIIRRHLKIGLFVRALFRNCNN
jgi:glycosyltransferase involved in cell wall biosynthesis